MKVDSNWFLFVKEKEILWSFGHPDEEFKSFVINFLTGLAQIGEEIFGENASIASIEFDLQKKSQVLSSELFIVNLSNKFYLMMSDPSTTMKMINLQGGIISEVEDILFGILVEQAAILYATSLSEVSSDESIKIEKVWQDIILDISDTYVEEIDLIVSANSSNFSRLAFEDLLFLHYHLRKRPELVKIVSPKGWSLVSNYSGGAIPLEYNMELDSVVLAGYLGIIISFISALFNSKPKNLAFGTQFVQNLRFINGKNEYFIAIDSPFTKLFLDTNFQTKFYTLQEEVIIDLQDALRKRIIEEILATNAEELEKQNLMSLLQENVLLRKSLFEQAFSNKNRIYLR